jgi:hypothetical protein
MVQASLSVSWRAGPLWPSDEVPDGARLCQSGDGAGAGWWQMKKPDMEERKKFDALNSA